MRVAAVALFVSSWIEIVWLVLHLFDDFCLTLRECRIERQRPPIAI